MKYIHKHMTSARTYIAFAVPFMVQIHSAPARARMLCIPRCWRAQLLVTERTGGYNILMSDWVAPYFCLGSANGWFKPSNEQQQRGIWGTVRTPEI